MAAHHKLHQVNLHDQGDEIDTVSSDEWRYDNNSCMVEIEEEQATNDHAVYDHANFYANFNKSPSSSSSSAKQRFLNCMAVLLAIIVTGIMIGVMASRAGARRVAHNKMYDTTNMPDPMSTTMQADHHIKSVAFDHRHNVEYDGVKFFKNNTNGVETVFWDAYAKTTEPITQLSFAAADMDHTKHIVLTTHPRDGYEYGGTQLEEEDDVPPMGEAVTIGLYRHGELWLPPQNALDTYSMADLFTLKVEEDKIVLYKNDTPIIKYDNPAGYGQPLYAQVWLKEPDASLLAVATRQEESSRRRRELVEAVTADYAMRSVLRGRMNTEMRRRSVVAANDKTGSSNGQNLRGRASSNTR